MNNMVRQTKRKTNKTHIHKSKDGGEPSSFEVKAVPEYYKAPVVLLIVKVACDRGNIQIVFDLFFE